MADTAEKTGTIDQYLGVNEIVERLGVSRSTLSRERAEGNFPAHIKIRGRKVWSEADVRKYLRQRHTVTHTVTHNSGLAPTAPHDFQSPGSGMLIEAPRMTPEAAEKFYRLLVKIGFPGVMVSLSGDHLIITWPDAMGYSEDAIERRVGKAVRNGERFA